MAIQLNVPANKTHWVEATSRDLDRYAFLGDEVRIEAYTRFVYELRTVQRSRSGDTHFLLTPHIYEVKDHVVTPRGDRIRPPEMDALFKTLEEAIRLHPVEFTVGAGGQVTHLSGLNALEDALAGLIGRADLQFGQMDPVFRHAWRRVFMAHIDERPIRRHIQRTYGFLPGGLVRLGEEWHAPNADAPWPFLPVEESTRLINRKDGRLYIVTSGEFAPPPESAWARYKGTTKRQIYVDPATGLGVQQQESTYWKRKRKRTPWEQFTLRSLEGSDHVRIEAGPLQAPLDIYAIHRFPFMEPSP